jgi:hypothetical protein
MYFTFFTPDDEALDPVDVNGIGTITLEVWKAKVIRRVEAEYTEPSIPFNEIHESQKKGGIHRVQYETHHSFGSHY